MVEKSDATAAASEMRRREAFASPCGRSAYAPRLAMSLVLCLGIAVWPDIAVSQERPDGRALGDMWQSAAPEPDWSGEEAAAAYALRSKRHKAFMQGGVPPEYRNARSPYPSADRPMREGGVLYRDHCAECHGPQGYGDGVAALDLRPTPAFLAYMIDSPDLVDEYLMWTIGDGGAQFETEMPAYKQVLSQRDIWKIVVYMRAGFPSLSEEADD